MHAMNRVMNSYSNGVNGCITLKIFECGKELKFTSMVGKKCMEERHWQQSRIRNQDANMFSVYQVKYSQVIIEDADVTAT